MFLSQVSEEIVPLISVGGVCTGMLLAETVIKNQRQILKSSKVTPEHISQLHVWFLQTIAWSTKQLKQTDTTFPLSIAVSTAKKENKSSPSLATRWEETYQ